MTGSSFAECFLLVPDLDAGRRFYETALGLEVKSTDDHSAVYDVSGTTFKLQADYPSDVFESFNLESPPESGRGEGAFFALDIDEDIDNVHQRVDQSEGGALFEPRSVDWLDEPMFLAEDPFGYTVEVR